MQKAHATYGVAWAVWEMTLPLFLSKEEVAECGQSGDNKRRSGGVVGGRLQPEEMENALEAANKKAR